MKSIKMQENKLKSYMWHEYEKDSYDDNSFYKNMFMEDVRLGILPIKLNRHEDTTRVIIEGEDSDSKIFKDILNSFNRQSNTYNTEELVKYVIEGIAIDISWYGEAIYEIYQENNDIRMVNLLADKFINLKFFYIQIPPKKNCLPYRIIKEKYIWKISIPKKLEKKYSYKRILSSIDRFDSLMPKPFREKLYSGNANYYNYDSKKYKEKQFLYVNDLTSDWGWNQRSMSDDVTTEFFKNYKYLKFDLSQAIFREHIVNELNTLLKRLNLNVSIKIEGIASSKDYEKQIEKYIKNEIDFDDVFSLNY